MSKKYSALFLYITVFYCAALIASNVAAGRLFGAPFGIVLPVSVWLFPVVYIIGDVVPEVYGFDSARRLIWLGFLANLFAVAFFELALLLPAPSFFAHREAYETVLGFTPRLLLASFIAYLCGTHVNAWIMVTLKRLTHERWLWLRTTTSTIAGEGIDSLLFIAIAFWGEVPIEALPGMIFAQAAFKILYEFAATPITYWVVAWFKNKESLPSRPDADLS
jgi:uncharacterized integral membrane protein (TIGR00697 family)